MVKKVIAIYRYVEVLYSFINIFSLKFNHIKYSLKFFKLEVFLIFQLWMIFEVDKDIENI